MADGVTVSLAIARFPETTILADLVQLVKDSDQALYRAKGSGRNRVCKAAIHIRSNREESFTGLQEFVDGRVQLRISFAVQATRVCTIHEIDEADGRTFIAMELLEGQTLRHKIRGMEAVPLAQQIAIRAHQLNLRELEFRTYLTLGAILSGGHVPRSWRLLSRSPLPSLY